MPAGKQASRRSRSDVPQVLGLRSGNFCSQLLDTGAVVSWTPPRAPAKHYQGLTASTERIVLSLDVAGEEGFMHACISRNVRSRDDT